MKGRRTVVAMTVTWEGAMLPGCGQCDCYLDDRVFFRPPGEE
ncbi:hypothetical protein SAMN05421505_102277 [Sinosporangium album]|uniref:Uncharacterized protein n=1 Tax=Sinosporangium album TaxID=504805 RepID=A0A1G7SG63_9ACTN|nr:hypothetical protein SAMN05421505_102277 [Sinosporangium album]